MIEQDEHPCVLPRFEDLIDFDMGSAIDAESFKKRLFELHIRTRELRFGRISRHDIQTIRHLTADLCIIAMSAKYPFYNPWTGERLEDEDEDEDVPRTENELF